MDACMYVCMYSGLRVDGAIPNVGGVHGPGPSVQNILGCQWHFSPLKPLCPANPQESTQRTLSLGLPVPSENVFGVGLEGPNTFYDWRCRVCSLTPTCIEIATKTLQYPTHQWDRASNLVGTGSQVGGVVVLMYICIYQDTLRGVY